MSNESENKNKRIDLTGFEGFTRDEWSQNGWHIGPNLIAELKRCYEEIDEMQGKVPYVEHCEVCGASDGEQTEGCGDCGIIHYQTSKGLIALHGYTWGFFHKDSPLWEKYQ